MGKITSTNRIIVHAMTEIMLSKLVVNTPLDIYNSMARNPDFTQEQISKQLSLLMGEEANDDLIQINKYLSKCSY